MKNPLTIMYAVQLSSADRPASIARTPRTAMSSASGSHDRSGPLVLDRPRKGMVSAQSTGYATAMA
jgi:hypothetical protein